MLAALTASILLLCGCGGGDNGDGGEDNGGGGNKKPQVTLEDLKGNWRLASWTVNGKAQSFGSDQYVYLVLRSDTKQFSLYQNIDSQGAVVLSGAFSLTNGILSGRYIGASSAVAWSNDYKVTDFDASRITLASVSNPDDVTRYDRVDKVPDEIVNASAAPKAAAAHDAAPLPKGFL